MTKYSPWGNQIDFVEKRWVGDKLLWHPLHDVFVLLGAENMVEKGTKGCRAISLPHPCQTQAILPALEQRGRRRRAGSLQPHASGPAGFTSQP